MFRVHDVFLFLQKVINKFNSKITTMDSWKKPVILLNLSSFFLSLSFCKESDYGAIIIQITSVTV